jgi:hypothetical protein
LFKNCNSFVSVGRRGGFGIKLSNIASICAKE